MKLLTLLSLGALLTSCTQTVKPRGTPVISDVACSSNSLLQAQNFRKKDYSVHSFKISSSTPSEGAGGEAYFVGNKLDHMVAGYYGSMGKTELRFSFADPDDYIVDVIEYTYEKPLDASSYTSVVHDRFFVCDGKTLNCENPERCTKFPWIESELKKIQQIISLTE